MDLIEIGWEIVE